MYTLILDSSDKNLSVGIAQDRVIDFISYEAWQSQSEYMISEIDKLFQKHNIKKEDLKDIIVTIGPGSYTGLRIALTIAKVTSFALSIPIYTISSLRVLSDLSRPSICLMNARSKRSYIGIYNGKDVIKEDGIFTNEEVLNYINEHPDYLVCGDTSYLGIEGYISNVIEVMFNLKDIATRYDDTLGIKPIYLKD